MKKLISLLVLAASLICLAASSPIVTNTLQRIQTDPQGANATATAFFEQKTVIDTQTFVAPWTPVSWPLVSDKTVTVDKQTLTYSQVSAFVTAIAEQEYAAQNAAKDAPKVTSTGSIGSPGGQGVSGYAYFGSVSPNTMTEIIATSRLGVTQEGWVLTK